MIKKFLVLAAIIFVLLVAVVALASVTNVSVGNGSGSPGDANIEVPINVGNLTGMGIISADIQLNYDPAVLSFVSLTSAGTVAEPWGVPIYNAKKPGEIKIALYGTTPLAGKGKLLRIRFNVNAHASIGRSSLILEKVKFNNGRHKIVIKNGVFRCRERITTTD